MSLLYRYITKGLIAAAFAVGTSSCVTQDLDECPNEYYAKFRFDMNIYDSDAFAQQVRSVDLYCFNHGDGRLVYQAHEHGDALAGENYRMRLDVAPGSYDIVVWAGMDGNTSFTPLPSAPAGKRDLGISVASGTESAALLTDVWHAARTVTFTDNNQTGSTEPQTATMSLIKDTNRINVYLVRLDGTQMSENDFSVRISAENADMAYDNSVSGNITYRQWTTDILHDYNTELNSITAHDLTVSTPTAHRSELSMGRLMATAQSRLEVIRNFDGKILAALPLEANLLQFRNQFYADMAPQEYLDRIDSADITFVLSDDNTWDINSKILINKWAVVPIQYVDW